MAQQAVDVIGETHEVEKDSTAATSIRQEPEVAQAGHLSEETPRIEDTKENKEKENKKRKQETTRLRLLQFLNRGQYWEAGPPPLPHSARSFSTVLRLS